MPSSKVALTTKTEELRKAVSDAVWPSNAIITQLQSDAVVIAAVGSDVAAGLSDMAATEILAGTAASATTVLLSDVATIGVDVGNALSSAEAIETAVGLLASDTSNTLSNLVIIKSDTVAVEAATIRAGAPTAKSGLVADTDLANNIQQASGLIATATGGAVLIESIVLMKDLTALAGPTNVELTTDNAAYGLTGVDAPVCSNVKAGLGAYGVLVGSAMATVALKAFVLSSGKKLYIHGDDAAGTSAGQIRYAVVGRGLAAGAVLT